MKEIEAFDASGKNQFYPTPSKLVDEMLNEVDFDYVHTILEPSAGKGDILKGIARKENERWIKVGFDVDCIEISPSLRQLLKYNFSEEYKKSFDYGSDMRKEFFLNGIHIVHDDFLTFNPYKEYDLIVMNPPFLYGDKHLLKALEIQKNGGNIICLLNAETLKNPFNETRKELARQLDEYSAQVQFIQDAFCSAEHKTNVEIALVKVSIPKVKEESDIYTHFKKADDYDEDDFNNITDLDVTNVIKAMTRRFDIECKAGIELIRQYRNLSPYMLQSFETVEVKQSDGTISRELRSETPILRLTDSCERGYESVTINGFLRAVRSKYWRALLNNQKFVGMLTSKLQEKYRKQLDKFEDYDFTEFNVYVLSSDINMQIKKGIEDELITLYDKLTEEHTWFPEMKNNRHYYDGWKTNKAHKIGKKVIIPGYGIWDSWDGKPKSYDAYNILSDIERCLNFLNGHMMETVDMERTLSECFKQGQTKNIHLKYFDATFYKKGTIHLTFNCIELIERFNIYVGKRKNWLPPCYGEKAYKNMTVEEKAAIDSFQGEQEYSKITKQANFYLAPIVSQNMLMLESGDCKESNK